LRAVRGGIIGGRRCIIGIMATGGGGIKRGVLIGGGVSRINGGIGM